MKASLGTVVKNIRLVHDNTEQIEGKIDGQTIVILTKYLRKRIINKPLLTKKTNSSEKSELFYAVCEV